MRWQEHLSHKLKEHAFVQDESDPSSFANMELDICVGVHVDDMLAVGPSELIDKESVAETRERHDNASEYGE